MTISLLTTFSGAGPSVTGTSYVASGGSNIDTAATPLTLTYANSSSVIKLSTYQFIIANGFN